MQPKVLPMQARSVGMHGSCILIETSGTGCAAVGIVVGILINRGIHPN
ncbi:hypothetical protein [Stenotrophomonas sp. YAU14D1_LEIMI4_1]|nr:hypothetical protein [Stenotrophomonas sp. YAU14D1_LEIMI4_1]